MARRLPVYLLLDCSGSMSGQPIEDVKRGVAAIHDALLGSPMAMDTAYLSVITFATNAKVEVPLTSLFDFQPPQITASGLTAMGHALDLLADSVEKDVARKKSEAERGDYRPLVFLFTDGHPTDDDPAKGDAFTPAVQRVRNMKWGEFVACAGGRNADLVKLGTIADTVLLMENMADLDKYFKWVSDSIVSSLTPDAQKPPLPRGVNLVKAPRV